MANFVLRGFYLIKKKKNKKEEPTKSILRTRLIPDGVKCMEGLITAPGQPTVLRDKRSDDIHPKEPGRPTGRYSARTAG